MILQWDVLLYLSGSRSWPWGEQSLDTRSVTKKKPPSLTFLIGLGVWEFIAPAVQLL